MLSSMSVDDDDDTLSQLAAQALRSCTPPQRRDEILAVLPTSLVVHVARPRPSAAGPARSDARAWLMGAMATAAVLCLVLLAALAWRRAHPTQVQVEAAPATLAAHRGVAPHPEAAIATRHHTAGG
jgi:hypothetical protein